MFHKTVMFSERKAPYNNYKQKLHSKFNTICIVKHKNKIERRESLILRKYMKYIKM